MEARRENEIVEIKNADPERTLRSPKRFHGVQVQAPIALEFLQREIADILQELPAYPSLMKRFDIRWTFQRDDTSVQIRSQHLSSRICVAKIPIPEVVEPSSNVKIDPLPEV